MTDPSQVPSAGGSPGPDGGSVALDQQRLLEFFRSCARRLAVRAEDPAAAAGADAYLAALERSAPRRFEPRWVQALDTVDRLDDAPLSSGFADIARLLPWARSPRGDDDGADLALASVEQIRDVPGFTSGLMYVRPNQQYPLHHHPPHEVYLTVAGHARWRWGGHTDLRPIGPDAVLYNRPDDLHTVIAGDTPLVAFFVLWPAHGGVP